MEMKWVHIWGHVGFERKASPAFVGKLISFELGTGASKLWLVVYKPLVVYKEIPC